jgi:hypothetical protein
MTRNFHSALIFAAFLSGTVRAHTLREGEVEVNISQGRIASSSSADIAEVTISGHLPGDCYRWSRSAAVAVSPHVYDVKAYAIMRAGPCRAMLVPFSDLLTMTNPGAGALRVNFRNPDGTFFAREAVLE